MVCKPLPVNFKIFFFHSAVFSMGQTEQEVELISANVLANTRSCPPPMTISPLLIEIFMFLFSIKKADIECQFRSFNFTVPFPSVFSETELRNIVAVC
jgi:hypothetical protein